jgi:hypothetical protein
MVSLRAELVDDLPAPPTGPPARPASVRSAGRSDLPRPREPAPGRGHDRGTADLPPDPGARGDRQARLGGAVRGHPRPAAHGGDGDGPAWGASSSRSTRPRARQPGDDRARLHAPGGRGSAGRGGGGCAYGWRSSGEAGARVVESPWSRLARFTDHPSRIRPEPAPSPRRTRRTDAAWPAQRAHSS